MIIVDHDHKDYRRRWDRCGKARWNGAFYYSQEIVKNIIPNVDTDRNWITVNVNGRAADHSVVFIHNNLHPEHYEWLKSYNDLVLVCGVPETVTKVEHIAPAIYLPLSIDVEYVERFKVPEDQRHGVAFVGRKQKRKMPGITLPDGIRNIEGLPRPKMLEEMAKLESVYAVGRTAIEAKALGVNVLPYDERFPDPDRWAVIDNLEAAKILQTKLDAIDNPEPEDITAEAQPSMDWTRSELQAWADDHGIEIRRRDTKQQIMDKIRGSGRG